MSPRTTPQPAGPVGGEPGAALVATCEVTEALLVIRYALHNTGSALIYVWDQLVKATDAGLALDPDGADIVWEEPSTARLTRALLESPLHHDIARKQDPFVRELAPGAAVEGAISLALPLRERNPYYPPAPVVDGVAQVHLTPCEQIRLVIGWVEARDGMTVQERTIGGVPALALRGSWSAPHQQLAEFAFAQQVALEVRADPFDRRPPVR